MPVPFARILLKWHDENPRPLPWSDGTNDPYKIWLSEIIMQQTRIEQGTSYYLRFVNRYPDIQSLAAAPLNDIMRLWEGLGYYTRARNMHKAANYIVDNLHGVFPATYEALLSLPGIGPYSAAAISSFAYNQPHVVVDGNVKRLISRYAGIYDSIDDPSTHEKIRQIASGFMKSASPALFNQAIMNFGALVCKPKPLCHECPFSKNCIGLLQGDPEALPVRTKNIKKKSRFLHFIVIHHRKKILLMRREQRDIWKGLYAPLVTELKSARVPSGKQIGALISTHVGVEKFEWLHSTSTVRQQITHQTIIGRFHHIRLLKDPHTLPDHYAWVTKKTMNEYGKPRMVVEMIS